MNRRTFLRRLVGAAGFALLAPSLGRAPVAVAAPVRDDAAWLQGQLNALRPGQTLLLAPGVYHLRRGLMLPPGRGIEGRRMVTLVAESVDSGLLTVALRNPGGPPSVVSGLNLVCMGAS